MTHDIPQEVVNPVVRAIDDLFSYETPAMRWLRIATEQLRAADEHNTNAMEDGK